LLIRLSGVMFGVAETVLTEELFSFGDKRVVSSVERVR